MFVFPNKSEVYALPAQDAYVLLKHFLTEGVDSTKIICVDKDLLGIISVAF